MDRNCCQVAAAGDTLEINSRRKKSLDVQAANIMGAPCEHAADFIGRLLLLRAVYLSAVHRVEKASEVKRDRLCGQRSPSNAARTWNRVHQVNENVTSLYRKLLRKLFHSTCNIEIRTHDNGLIFNALQGEHASLSFSILSQTP